MGPACFFAMDSIPNRYPNSNPPSPTRFDNDEGRGTVPIFNRVSRCRKFIRPSTILDLPSLPRQNEKL